MHRGNNRQQSREHRDQQRLALALLLRRHQTEIVAAWEREARQRASQSGHARPVLSAGHVGRLIEHMADIAEHAETADSRDRSGQGLDDDPFRDPRQGPEFQAVVSEYAILRRILLRLVGAEMEGLAPGELEILNGVIDQGIVGAAAAETRARRRTLEALDRLEEAAVAGERDTEKFLPRLLDLLLEVTPAVDSVVVALLEGDRLRVRAAVGLERELVQSCSYELGEGVLGRAASTRRPVMLHAAAQDPLVRCEGVRTSSTGALYAVPLMHGDQVIGAAQMGSRSAADFSDADKLLFRTMASRAAALITQAQLLARERAARLEAESARRELERLGLFREQFLGMIGHDLRNPLGAITMSAQLLQRQGATPPAAARTYRSIVANAGRMARMIDDLLDFTRGRLGRGIPIEPAPMDMHMVSRGLLEDLRLSHPGRILRLSAVGDGHGRWDPDRIVQLLSNLVGNALQHGAAGAPIGLCIAGDESSVVVEVNNEGPPIPHDELSHLFEPFRRARNDAGPREGLGLGLYIVQQIAHAHGGSVDVRSTAETGTTFSVQLPRVPPTNQQENQ